MKKLYFIITLVCIALFNNSCYHEDDLTPSGEFRPVGLEFPQGNNAWDKEIEKIHDTYGVYIFYKDVTEALLNRQWTSIGTGDLIVGEDLSDEKVPFYINFIENDVFKYVNRKLISKTLPVRLYMLDNLRTKPRDSGEDDTENPDTGDTGTGGTDTGTGGTDTGTGGTDTGTGGTDTGTGGTDTGTGGTDTGTGGEPVDPNFIPFYTDGFDYWAISFTDYEIKQMSPEGRRMRSIPFIYQMLRKAVMKGYITDPDAIREEINPKKRFDNRNIENEDHHLNRGFPEDLFEDFSRSVTPWHPSQFYGSDAPGYPHGDFLNLIRTNMWYSEAELERKYPRDKYPLIRKRLDIVNKHLLDNYGIDLKTIGAH